MELHPITVHFTIGLFFTGLAFELAGILFRRTGLRIAGWWNLLAAAFSALASILTGRSSEASLPHTDAIHTLMTAHEQWAWWFLAAIILSLVIRTALAGGPPLKKRASSLWMAVGLVLLLVASGFIFSGAKLGGKMVYGHGMGVVPMMESMRDDHSHGADGKGDYDPGVKPDSRADETKETDFGHSSDDHDHSGHSH